MQGAARRSRSLDFCYLVMTINCGALAPVSRLAKLTAVALSPLTARLNVPFPVTRGVTSIVIQELLLNAPIEPT